MIWKELWKVILILVVCYEIIKRDLPAIGMRGPIYGVIQNVWFFYVHMHDLFSYEVVGRFDDLCP